jgi:hypothetical protein
MSPLKCSWVWYGHLLEFAVAWLIVQVTCIMFVMLVWHAIYGVFHLAIATLISTLGWVGVFALWTFFQSRWAKSTRSTSRPKEMIGSKNR